MKVDFRQLPTQVGIDELHMAIGRGCSEDTAGGWGFDFKEPDFAEGCTCSMWETRDGIKMPVWMMTENHIQNSVRMLGRGAAANMQHQIGVAEQIYANTTAEVWAEPDVPEEVERTTVDKMFQEQMYLSTQEERLRRGIAFLRTETDARAAGTSLWNETGDVKDWSPEGIDELVQKVMQGRPFG